MAVAAFSLACRLTPMADAIRPPDAGVSAAGAVLGASRLGLAAHVFAIADIYFHKGAPHRAPAAFENDWFQTIGRVVAPLTPEHAAGVDVREILPWLWLAVRLDPRNTDFVLVAAFWLSREAQRADAALDLLRDAQCRAPFNYEIQMERGRIFLRQRRLAAAAASFDAALRFWPGRDPADSVKAREARASILLYRALLYEAEGRPDAALAAWKDVVAIHPERAYLLDRVQALAAGQAPAVAAPALWKKRLQAEDASRAACPHEEEHDGGRDHAEEHVSPRE